MRSFLAGIVAAVCLLAPGTPSAAADIATEAKRHFAAGFDALSGNELDKAIAEFGAGIAIKDDARAEYYLGQAFEQKGDAASALAHYRQSLKLNAKSDVAANARAAEKQLRQSENASASPAPPPGASGEARGPNVDCRAAETERVAYAVGDRYDPGRLQLLQDFVWYHCMAGTLFDGRPGPPAIDFQEFRTADPDYPDCFDLTRRWHADKALANDKEVMAYWGYWCAAHDIGGVGAVAARLMERQEQQAAAQQQQQQQDIGAEIVEGVISGVIGGLLSRVPGASSAAQQAAPSIAHAIRPAIVPAAPRVVVPPPHLPPVLQVGRPAPPPALALQHPAPVPAAVKPPAPPAATTLAARTTPNPAPAPAAAPKGATALEGAQACSYMYQAYETATVARNTYLAQQSLQSYNQYCRNSASLPQPVVNATEAAARMPPPAQTPAASPAAAPVPARPVERDTAVPPAAASPAKVAMVTPAPGAPSASQIKLAVPLPAGRSVDLKPPAAAVPKEIADLAGIWEGTWDGTTTSGDLIVEWVGPAGDVIGTYAWSSDPPAAAAFAGHFANGTLAWTGKGSRGEIYFEFSPRADGTLLGTRRVEGFSWRNFITMRKIASPPSPAVAAPVQPAVATAPAASSTAVAMVTPAPSPAPARSAASAFDGVWKGAYKAKDTGNCEGRDIAEHDMTIDGGQLRDYAKATRGGALAVSGGFVDGDGTFRASGAEPGKGTFTLNGRAADGKLSGRWSFGAGGRRQQSPSVYCEGEFEFENRPLVPAATASPPPAAAKPLAPLPALAVPLPADIAVEMRPPSADVAPDLAAFAGVWEGRWGGQTPADLVIETVGRDGTVSGVSLYAGNPQFNQPRSANRFTAKIEDGVFAAGPLRLVMFPNGQLVGIYRKEGINNGVALRKIWPGGGSEIRPVNVSAGKPVPRTLAPPPDGFDFAALPARADAPPAVAGFLGVWEGYWSKSARPADLIVVGATAAGRALGFYCYGEGSGRFSGTGCIPFVETIGDAAFTVSGRGRYMMKFTLAPGAKIEGVETLDGYPNAGVTLARIE